MKYASDHDLTAVLIQKVIREFPIRFPLNSAKICETTDACLFLVADQPYISKSSITRLISNWHASSKGIACMSWESHMGNPVLFASTYYPELFH